MIYALRNYILAKFVFVTYFVFVFKNKSWVNVSSVSKVLYLHKEDCLEFIGLVFQISNSKLNLEVIFYWVGWTNIDSSGVA